MITPAHIVNMINHWLDTPANGYFSQGYGSDVRAMLLKNLSAETADKFIAKLRADMPLLDTLDTSQLSIQTEQKDFDKLYIYLFVGSTPILLGNTQEISGTDYYDNRAS